MEQVLQILSELRPDVDFTREQLLIDDGVLVPSMWCRWFCSWRTRLTLKLA